MTRALTDVAAASPGAVVPAAIHALSKDHQESYRKNGSLILRGFFAVKRIERAASEAAQALRRTELISTDNIRCRWQDHVQTGQCQFDAFDPILDLSPACAELATDASLLAALGALYGEEACLFKDKLIFKPPGSKGYGLHQDYIAWPSFPRSFLTVVIPLDPCDAENGATEVFPGYHQRGALSPEDGDYHELPIETVDLSTGVKLALGPGDIAIFSGFVPHRSAPNHSDRWRRQLYFSYNALSDGGSQRDAHYREFHVWLKSKYAKYGRENVYFR